VDGIADPNTTGGVSMSRLVACVYCGLQDERTELMPVDDRTLFGDLVNPNTDWYCSDCADTWAEKTGRVENEVTS
jgi:hypothetical protein